MIYDSPYLSVAGSYLFVLQKNASLKDTFRTLYMNGFVNENSDCVTSFFPLTSVVVCILKN